MNFIGKVVNSDSKTCTLQGRARKRLLARTVNSNMKTQRLIIVTSNILQRHNFTTRLLKRRERVHENVNGGVNATTRSEKVFESRKRRVRLNVQGNKFMWSKIGLLTIVY